MNTFLQLLISGLALGGVYALLALGFVVVFKATEVVNFAHASLVMVGIYVMARARDGGMSFPVALLVGALAAVTVALVVERLFVRPTARQSLVAAAIMTIGVDIIVQTEVTRRLGIDILPVGDPWGSNTVEILGVTVPETRVAALIVAVAALAAFFAWFKFSDWGVAMRATAEDHPTAELMGVHLGRVSALTWTIAAVLATVAGVFLASFPSPGVSPGVSTAAL
ncbi:MAG TPA: branched-chain amino acid ABC transporter permease, partial [Acidimicrobiales bacterium]|nr:branched-chain amino acid ABC transporter permease [Acidimicrobiales bacterium]